MEGMKGGREKEKERNIHAREIGCLQHLTFTHPDLNWESNPQHFGPRVDALTTENMAKALIYFKRGILLE